MKCKRLGLGTIDEEAAACRKAFEGVEVGAPVVHCHHEREWVELLVGPAEHRIRCILVVKPRSEHALRLRLFRPMCIPAGEIPEWDEALAQCQCARAEYARARAEYNESGSGLCIMLLRPEYVRARAEYNPARAEYVRAPNEYNPARAEYARARAEYARASNEYECARAEYDRTWDKLNATFAPLHDKYCPAGKDCPWDGESIFGREKK